MLNWIYSYLTTDEKTKEVRERLRTTNTVSPQANINMDLWYFRQMERWNADKNLCDASQMDRWRTGKDPCDANQTEHKPCDAIQMALWNTTYMELYRTRKDLWDKLPAKFKLNFVSY